MKTQILLLDDHVAEALESLEDMGVTLEDDHRRRHEYTVRLAWDPAEPIDIELVTNPTDRLTPRTVREWLDKSLEAGHIRPDLVFIDDQWGKGPDEAMAGQKILLPMLAGKLPEAWFFLFTAHDEQEDRINALSEHLRHSHANFGQRVFLLGKGNRFLLQTLISAYLGYIWSRDDARQQKVRNAELEQELRHQLDYRKCQRIVSKSAAFKSVFQQAQDVAPTQVPVLITGDSGTGKELVARAIHGMSPRKDKPFVPVNCGAITETLLESELFGHVKGSFTGAVSDKKGMFEAAEGGTLFLDEIGEMLPAAQVKLLRILESDTFIRVGGTEEKTADVRVIAATNQRIDEALKSGRLREDLFHRLNVVHLVLPALRERPEDIPLLAEEYLREFCAKHGKKVQSISGPARQVMFNYAWPGNCRELRNAMESVVLFNQSGTVDIADLPASIAQTDSLRPSDVEIDCANSGTVAFHVQDAVGWLEEISLPKLKKLCEDIWNSNGQCIGNNPDNIVGTLAHSPHYLRAVLAAFWHALSDRQDTFNRLFGFLLPPRKTMDVRLYLSNKTVPNYPKVFPAGRGRKKYGISDLKADGEDLANAGFELYLR